MSYNTLLSLLCLLVWLIVFVLITIGPEIKILWIIPSKHKSNKK